MIRHLKGYFKSLIPANTPSALTKKGDLLIIQERILHALYICGSSVLLLALLFINPLTMNAEIAYVRLIYPVLCGIFILFTLWRKAPFKLKAFILLSVLYLASVFGFVQNGFSGAGGIMLLSFILLTVVLIGPKSGLRSGLFSLLTVLLLAFAYKSKIIPAPDSANLLTVTTPIDWFRYGFPLVFLVSLTATSISILLNTLHTHLEQTRSLSNHLQNEQKKLDRLLRDGTSRMEQRELQMRTASQLSREISTNLDPKALLDNVVENIRKNFNLYYVGLFMVDDAGRYAVLRAGTGVAGESMIASGHRLEIGGASMIGWCISNQQARIALDVGADPVRFNNPYLPRTHSEMALPIVFQNQALGALSIQSDLANAFSNEDIVILQSIADSLAIALENGKLFQSTQQALDELRMYNKAYIQETWGQTLAAQGDLTYSYQDQTVHLPDGKVSEVSIPISLRDEKIGDIRLETNGEKFGQEDLAFLDTILTQTALALENARLIEETQRRAVQEQRLNDLSTQLSKASSIEYILQTTARELGQLPLVSEVSLQLLSRDEEPAAAPSGSNGNGKEH